MINDSHSNEIDFEERLSPHFTVGEMMRSGKAVGMGVKNVPEVNPPPGEASRTAQKACGTCDSRGRLSL